ncbi:hypothetical protein BV25DRAFT_1993153 [Artomyces pyxidatus]|uniref:Uncharacterized protein n=1 Tax=Artomyces pyxidatus TaxID=48021 RepID=A0ACB8SUF0_9AGAM|nr:hypothetical protein BV25DRAFT_1993153 [Artomyces pyxidatus]
MDIDREKTPTPSPPRFNSNSPPIATIPDFERNGKYITLMSSPLETLPGPYWMDLEGQSPDGAHSSSIFLPDGDSRVYIKRKLEVTTTGVVWEVQAGGSVFVAKVVEATPRRQDQDKRQRLHLESQIHAALEEEYRTGPLISPLAPRCYGLFTNQYMDVLLLEAYEHSTLPNWNNLCEEECDEIFDVIVALHKVGIKHGSIVPQNIARTAGGGFRLVNFSEGAMHVCPAYAQDTFEEKRKKAAPAADKLISMTFYIMNLSSHYKS